jgi:phage host-nuclease inhibitor protein Gam
MQTTELLIEQPMQSQDTRPAQGGPGDPEIDAEILSSVPRQFAIVDEQSANWLIRKIAAARQYAVQVAGWAEQEKRRAAREEQCLMYLFGRQIELWAKSEIEQKKGKRKSLSLPAGVVGFRAVAPSLQVDDEKLVLEWARSSCPGAVTTVTLEKLSRAVLKDHFESTGEMPSDGAHVERGGERFYIK